MSATATSPSKYDGPFAAPSTLDLNYPRFDRIKDSDFAPAFDAGMAQLNWMQTLAIGGYRVMVAEADAQAARLTLEGNIARTNAALSQAWDARDVAERDLKRNDLAVKYVPVSAATRLTALTSGEIDLECGSTTSTAAADTTWGSPNSDSAGSARSWPVPVPALKRRWPVRRRWLASQRWAPPVRRRRKPQVRRASLRRVRLRAECRWAISRPSKSRCPMRPAGAPAR